jgi:hypothetical protein
MSRFHNDRGSEHLALGWHMLAASISCGEMISSLASAMIARRLATFAAGRVPDAVVAECFFLVRDRLGGDRFSSAWCGMCAQYASTSSISRSSHELRPAQYAEVDLSARGRMQVPRRRIRTSLRARSAAARIPPLRRCCAFATALPRSRSTATRTLRPDSTTGATGVAGSSPARRNSRRSTRRASARARLCCPRGSTHLAEVAMILCEPCRDRGRRNVAAAKVVAGTPMCFACIDDDEPRGGGVSGAPRLSAPH